MEQSIKVLLGIIATSLVVVNFQLAGLAFVGEAHAQYDECYCSSEIGQVLSVCDRASNYANGASTAVQNLMNEISGIKEDSRTAAFHSRQAANVLRKLR